MLGVFEVCSTDLLQSFHAGPFGFFGVSYIFLAFAGCILINCWFTSAAFLIHCVFSWLSRPIFQQLFACLLIQQWHPKASGAITTWAGALGAHLRSAPWCKRSWCGKNPPPPSPQTWESYQKHLNLMVMVSSRSSQPDPLISRSDMNSYKLYLINTS